MDYQRSGFEVMEEALIPGLPDVISVSCLARIPRHFHQVLRVVSKRWRQLVCSDEFYSYRRRNGLDETWVYALCLDTGRYRCYVLDPNSIDKHWKLLEGMPTKISQRVGMGFEVLGTNIYFLGGSDGFQGSTNEVYCYDASRNTWSRAAPLLTPMSSFICEAFNEKIYIIGGTGLIDGNPHAWSTYDPRLSDREYHAIPDLYPGVEDSIVLDGKMLVRHSAGYASLFNKASEFDPSNGMFRRVDEKMVDYWNGPAAVVDGTLYVIDGTLGLRLMKWDRERNEWVVVCGLPSELTPSPHQLLAIGKKLLVIDKGLGSTVLDIDWLNNGRRVVPEFQIPRMLSHCTFIKCKLLSL